MTLGLEEFGIDYTQPVFPACKEAERVLCTYSWVMCDGNTLTIAWKGDLIDDLSKVHILTAEIKVTDFWGRAKAAEASYQAMEATYAQTS